MSGRVILKSEYFDLRAICNSGQVFRMYECESGVFDVYSADRHLRVREINEASSECRAEVCAVNGPDDFATSAKYKNIHTYEFFCPQEEFEGYWWRYFDLGRDYGTIVSSARESGDEFVREACEKYAGIRILHQNIWEMMISFIISQQKQIPSIRKCIEGLCERFGELKRSNAYAVCESGRKECVAAGRSEMGSKESGTEGCDVACWRAFPTPEAIAAGGPEGLKGLSLGYRERYIYETAVQYLDHGLPDAELEAMDYADAKKYLLSFTGIGEKVANCILLFGAGFVDAFPIDTHIKDILYRRCYLEHGLPGKDIADERTALPQEKPEAEKPVQKSLPQGKPEAGKPAQKSLPQGKPEAEKPAQKSLPQEKLTQADYEALTREHFAKYSPNRGIVQQWIFAAEIE